MHTDTLVIGQGLSGTFLSFYLRQCGIDCLVIDNAKENAASRVAAGIINPVTGRRLVTVWKDSDVLPFAEKAYQEMDGLLKIQSLVKTAVVDMFPNPFMKESFDKRMLEGAPYLHKVAEGSFDTSFKFDFGYGLIAPAYIVHTKLLLYAWQQYLAAEQKVIVDDFDITELKVSDDRIAYKNITARRIIFCDGVQSSLNNPFFGLLPFAINKGEVLQVQTANISADFMYKKSMMMVPQPAPQTFWVGTNYVWHTTDETPTAAFEKETAASLNRWLKRPFSVLSHLAALRPATVERRPFVGFHPVYKNVGILNGMGSKGCSLAPYFAYQLAQNIKEGTPVEDEANIIRFAKLLSRAV